jgi:hypothetical protein
MSAAENLDVQTEIKKMLVNHPDSADAVIAQLKDQLLAELVPDEQFREMILEVTDGLKGYLESQIEKVWFQKLMPELIEFLKDTGRDKAFLDLIRADDLLMDSLREDSKFIEMLIGELPTPSELDSDELIGEVMKRYHAHDMDIRHFINDVQLNNPLVMRRRE